MTETQGEFKEMPKGPLHAAVTKYIKADDVYNGAGLKREEAKSALIPEMEKAGLSTCVVDGRRVSYSKAETDRVTVKKEKDSV